MNNKQAKIDPAKIYLFEALEGTIEPVKTNVLYRFTLLIVAVVMLILPLIYISLIGVVGYGVYWHATENLAYFQIEAGRAVVFFYFIPMIIGIVVILFMVKPLFAPKEKIDVPQILNKN